MKKVTMPVIVILGLPFEDDTPVPATIMQWPSGKKRAFQHLSAEQRAAMGADAIAIWDAEFIDGHYWLATRMKHLDDREAFERFMFAPVDFATPIRLDDSELPF